MRKRESLKRLQETKYINRNKEFVEVDVRVRVWEVNLISICNPNPTLSKTTYEPSNLKSCLLFGAEQVPNTLVPQDPNPNPNTFTPHLLHPEPGH